MQTLVAGFRVQIPGLEHHLFPSGTIILLTGRPGVGKSVFAKQFCLEGARAGHRIVAALTDTTAENFRSQAGVESSKLDAVDFLLEKPTGVHEISTVMRQLITKTPKRPVRLIFDSLSTLGTMFNPALLAPWLLDLRATLLKETVNVIALVNFATGINPPSVTRSLHPFADVVLEMRIDESKEEIERQFRISVARGVSHSTKWIPFEITDAGIEFGSVPLEDDLDRMLLTVNRNVPGYDRVFGTVLFTYTDEPNKHFGLLRQEVDRFRGREIFRTRNGMLAIFDRPEQAVLCACSIRDRVQSLGLGIRAGLHAGEVQLVKDSIAGIAVHVSARIASRANPSEVLVSSILKDLVAGSGIEFLDRGRQTLKGVSGEWHLFAVSKVAEMSTLSSQAAD